MHKYVFQKLPEKLLQNSITAKVLLRQDSLVPEKIRQLILPSIIPSICSSLCRHYMVLNLNVQSSNRITCLSMKHLLKLFANNSVRIFGPCFKS